MKNKLKSFFSKTRKSKTGLILTIVALVEILAIMVVSTSAWIESISSIKVYTTAQSESGGTKGTVASKLKQRVGLAVNNSTEIDLTEYFRPSGGYHLSGASSADGNAIYFPETKGNTTKKYRVGTINDKNVNYISFTVKTTTGSVALAFDSTPTISFGGTPLSGDQMDLVRFSVGNGSTFKVFSLAEEFEDTVISGENSTDTASSTVRSFSDYAAGNTNLVTTTTANGYLTFNMWIQDPTGTRSEIYNNKELTVENLKLVAVKPFTLRATYMNDNGSYVAGTTGGSVAINNGEFGATAVAYLKNGSVVTLKASPNSTNGYSFVGWSKSANGSVINNMGVSNCTDDNGIYSILYTFNPSDFSGDYDLYAQFNDRHILYLKPNYKHYNGNNGSIKFYAYIWGSVNGAFKKEWYDSTYDSTKAAYKFTYKGSANSVIFCYMSPSTPAAATVNTQDAAGTDVWASYRWLQTYDLSFPLENGEYTYVVTSRRDPYASTGQVLGYWEHSYAKANIAKCTDTASQNSGNSVYMYLDHAYTHYENAGSESRLGNNSSITFDGKQYTMDGDGVTLSYPYNATVTLTATPGDAYNFVGWYTNAAGTTAVSASTGLVSGAYTDKSITVTRDNANAVNNGTTYYAKFAEKPEAWEIYGAKGSESSTWSGTTLTRESSSSNFFTGTVTLTEGQNFYFKIHDKKSNAYYGLNNAVYDGYTTTPILNDGKLYDSGGNMRIRAHAGTYQFRWNYSTKKLTISVTSWSNITITFSYSGYSWINESSAVISFYAPNMADTNMSPNTSTTATSRTLSIASNLGNAAGSIGFNRWSSTSHSGNPWNEWKNVGSRGFSTTYKVSGDGSGSWQ